MGNIIKMLQYYGYSQMLRISLKMEKSFIAHPWCLQSVVGLECIHWGWSAATAQWGQGQLLGMSEACAHDSMTSPQIISNCLRQYISGTGWLTESHRVSISTNVFIVVLIVMNVTTLANQLLVVGGTAWGRIVSSCPFEAWIKDHIHCRIWGVIICPYTDYNSGLVNPWLY